jgi:hypothetical protein
VNQKRLASSCVGHTEKQEIHLDSAILCTQDNVRPLCFTTPNHVRPIHGLPIWPSFVSQVTIVNSAATLLPRDGFAPRFKVAMIDEVAAAGVELLLNTRVVWRSFAVCSTEIPLRNASSPNAVVSSPVCVEWHLHAHSQDGAMELGERAGVATVAPGVFKAADGKTVWFDSS